VSILAQARADLGVTLEGATEFGQSIVLTDPTGFTSVAPLLGQAQDIGRILDPETGVFVSGRFASVTLRLSTLTAVSGYASFPIGVPEKTSLPWTVSVAGELWHVLHTIPDRTLDVLVCILGFYQNA